MWLVDVRAPSAFEEVHVEGAMNIPGNVVPTKRFPKQKMIVLVDDSLGLRDARKVADQLVKSGQEKVFVMDGGMHGWQAEGYGTAGKGMRRRLPMVTREELAWSRENRVALNIYDLREKDEMERSPFREALSVGGADLIERLKRVNELLAPQNKKSLANKLSSPTTTILVLPLAPDAREVAERAMLAIHDDVRLVDGGIAAWMAKPETKAIPAASCPVCPGGKKEEVKR